ncbi:NAD(P)/FAD-dependent oxidoreductase [Rivularia sp. UHCC 0363]|uniref:FAD-dependent oxidoreductase n=1 Tax=Rivularia sp. UHCC 0363 TaxID=3110244 RepID=UPI002B220D8D|nr:NAD(P)/FAD-dependent oxidoreductase [Rivularia sp. UHCC 0363]MEA5593319.1 NAD(P)/FAD-dependent oxidoreductase [Rivularia sp. UHCC 0363]
MLKKVAIIGAGPCGLLLAHYLLSRDRQYQVEIYEHRGDPRIVSYSDSRTFPIGLNDRGYNALSKIPGLESAIKAASTPVTNIVSHRKNGKTKVISRSKPLFSIDRNDLVKVLLDLLQKYHSSELKINFHCKYDGTLEPKIIKFRNLGTQTDFDVDYDLLIGADGARSVVRKNFAELSDTFEYCQAYIPNAYKSVFISASKNTNHCDRKQGKIHFWDVEKSTRVLLVEQADGSLNGVIRFPYQKNSVANLKNVEEASLYFQQNCPQLKELMSTAEIEAFVNNPISRVTTVRCNRYHQGENALLIGDAAHAVSPALGQGCNSALEDVLILNNLLDEYSDNWAEAIQQFTIRRKADADALVELSKYSSPLSPRLSTEFGIRQSINKALHRFFPQHFSPPLFESLSQPSVRYSEILSSYKGWVSKVKKSNEKLLAQL